MGTHWLDLPVLINRMQSIIRRVIDGDTMVVCRSQLNRCGFIVMMMLVAGMLRMVAGSGNWSFLFSLWGARVCVFASQLNSTQPKCQMIKWSDSVSKKVFFFIFRLVFFWYSCACVRACVSARVRFFDWPRAVRVDLCVWLSMGERDTHLVFPFLYQFSVV